MIIQINVNINWAGCPDTQIGAPALSLGIIDMKEAICIVIMFYCVLRICWILGTWSKRWHK